MAPPPSLLPGRDKLLTYQVETPSNWSPLPSHNDLQDTRNPIAAWSISQDTDIIEVTLHNFPTEEMEQRIPAEAQVERWKRQFSYLDPLSTEITPQSHGGFAGLLFKGEGILNEKRQGMLAWSMLIAPKHYQILNHPDQQQMRADYTIKAVGPTQLLKEKAEEIYLFARSFRLIEEIPER